MKAVVVLDDMPARCDECCLRHRGMAQCNVGHFSTSHFASGKPVDQTKRHPKCPLRLLPLKMSAPTYRDYDDYRDMANYIAGWNHCIDKVTGEYEESKKPNLNLIAKENKDDKGRGNSKK